MNPRNGIAAPPVPSGSNNWLNSWICSASSSQNWGLTLDTWAPKSISAVVSCPFIITGALLEHPTNWAMGSGFRKGTGVTFCSALSMVGFGLGSGRECWEPTVGCCGWCWQGVGPHSLGSPWTGLKSWLGWHIPKPCGPSLGTWNTEGNWCPSYLKCLPGYLWTLGHFPGFDLWSLFCD